MIIRYENIFCSFILILFATMMSSHAFAQIRDVSVGVGVYKPLYKGVGGDVSVTAGYGQFSSSGLGFRAGLQWTSSVAKVDHAFGAPVAFAWRSPSRTASERLHSGAAGTMRGYGYSSLEEAAGSLLAGFLMNLFSDVEFYAGVTPGWISGVSSPKSTTYQGSKVEEKWTEKRSPFFLTLDAGMCINYSIWRFDVKLMPAFHFDPLGSLCRHAEPAGTEMPLRWFFSFSGGLAYRF